MSIEVNDNVIIPYKDREINFKEPVRVYRNLNAKGSRRTYSIKQKGLVVAHTTRICLKNCKFLVQEGGRQRFLRTGERNVHAWIEGVITPNGMGTTVTKNDLSKITYNPSKSGFFVFQNHPVKEARFVVCNEDGIGASYFE
jgi:uncharacterized protein YjiK